MYFNIWFQKIVLLENLKYKLYNIAHPERFYPQWYYSKDSAYTIYKSLEKNQRSVLIRKYINK